jgi:hypothetical protein
MSIISVVYFSEIFRIDGIKSVFLGPDFITVTKQDDDNVEWKSLKPEVKNSK